MQTLSTPLRLSLLLAALGAAFAASAQTRYRIQVLTVQTDPVLVATGNGINNAGRITGEALDFRNGFEIAAYRGTASGFELLPTLGGSQSGGYAINDADQVTGYSSLPGDNAYHAFRYRNGATEDLGTLGGSNSIGFGINASGQVAGRSSLAGDAVEHAFRYANGTMQDLGALRAGSTTNASGINADGDVVGYDYDPTTKIYRAFRYTDAGGMLDLGTLAGGEGALASAINDSGQIVGNAGAADGTDHGFLWSNGAMIDIGSFGGAHTYAQSINNAGQVVGMGELPNSGERHAFLYTVTGGMMDLNDLLDTNGMGLTIYGANGINASGQIVADAFDANRFGYTVVLTPVPEPASVAAFGLGAAALLRRRKRA